ncbi:hypothetical protein L7F22_043425 [Adiantum nelumboides]|nr:hypothetical protein [Adiantum nelumboides]
MAMASSSPIHLQQASTVASSSPIHSQQASTVAATKTYLPSDLQRKHLYALHSLSLRPRPQQGSCIGRLKIRAADVGTDEVKPTVPASAPGKTDDSGALNQLLGIKGATAETNKWKIRLQLTKPVTWPPLIWGVVCGAAASGRDHNEDSDREYGPPRPTQAEQREMERRKLIGDATNMMLNFGKDPKLAKYMTDFFSGHVHAQWKKTTTPSPKPALKKPSDHKQYSEKELEESTFDKAKKHKKRVRFDEVPSSSSPSSDSSSDSSEEDRKGKKRIKKQRFGKGKKKVKKSKSHPVNDSSTEDTSTDTLDSDDGKFYANRRIFIKPTSMTFWKIKARKSASLRKVDSRSNLTLFQDTKMLRRLCLLFNSLTSLSQEDATQSTPRFGELPLTLRGMLELGGPRFF